MKESLENETPLYRRRFVAAVQVLEIGRAHV